MLCSELATIFGEGQEKDYGDENGSKQKAGMLYLSNLVAEQLRCFCVRVRVSQNGIP